MYQLRLIGLDVTLDPSMVLIPGKNSSSTIQHLSLDLCLQDVCMCYSFQHSGNEDVASLVHADTNCIFLMGHSSSFKLTFCMTCLSKT